MVGITTYSVTLYRLYCQATGANGTTQRVAAAIATQLGREVTVLFDTNVAPGLPWRFTPVQRSIKLHLGQDALVFFEAENLSNQDITGHATFNVTPEMKLARSLARNRIGSAISCGCPKRLSAASPA